MDKEKAKQKLKGAGEKVREKLKGPMGRLSGKFERITSSAEFKSMSPMTWVGLGLAALFLIFMVFSPFNLRWWMMIPLGLGGLFVLGRQWLNAADKNSTEARTCLAAFIALVAMMLYRDIKMSEVLLKLGRTASEFREYLR